MTSEVPTRAVLNFAHRCAMRCEWCYVPFGAPAADEKVVNSIVVRVAELGFGSITIGGGDPFQHGFLKNTLQVAKAHGLFVHVDTHGIALRESHENWHLVDSKIDLLGLPMDGPTAAVHDTMRGYEGHYGLVERRLKWLGALRSKVKLNTVVSRTNANQLVALANRVALIRPSRWSIYQYWDLGPAAGVSEKHSLDDLDFQLAAEQVRDIIRGGPVVLEVNARESRRDTYPIIRHDGSVSVHSASPKNDFVCLGSIFSDDILKTIYDSCGSERVAASSRYAGQ